jgi:hypothetical protein
MSLSNVSWSPTITIGSAASQHTINILDSLSGLNSDYHKVKRYEVCESPEDTLALSVTWKRLRDAGKSTSGKILDRQLFDEVTDADREEAKVIRDYYSKKIMMWKLKGDKPFTPYREDLNKFVHSDGTIVRNDMMGLIYYLPIFHQYDTELDVVKDLVTTNQSFKKMDESHTPKVMTLTASLEPLKKIAKKRKRATTIEYWFKDNKVNSAVVMTLDKKNPLEHIWENVFNTEKVLQIKGAYCRRKQDEFEYYSIDNWTLEKA